MTLIKKTCVLSKQGVKGHVNVVRVADSVGAKIVFDGYFDGLYAALKIGYGTPIILKLSGAKSEFNLTADLTNQDEISCIISDGKTLFAEGGRQGVMHPIDIARHLDSLTAKPAVKERSDAISSAKTVSTGNSSQNHQSDFTHPTPPTNNVQNNTTVRNTSSAASRENSSMRNANSAASRANSSNANSATRKNQTQQRNNSSNRQQQGSRPKPPPTPVLSPEVAMQMVSMAMQMNNKPVTPTKSYPKTDRQAAFHDLPDVEVIDVIPEEIQVENSENYVSTATENSNSETCTIKDNVPNEQYDEHKAVKTAATQSDTRQTATTQSATRQTATKQSTAEQTATENLATNQTATEKLATEKTATESATKRASTEKTATESATETATKQAVTETATTQAATETATKQAATEETATDFDTEHEQSADYSVNKDTAAFSQSFLRGLTDKDFYLSIKDKLDELFIIYPRESLLEKLVPSSKWVKINYDADDYYVTGVLIEEDKVSHIVYGVPAIKEVPPPKGMENICDFLPVDGLGKFSGYYLIFQDINTGEILPGG